MKHLASFVKDGQVSYALVDEESGQITQFAQILVPDTWDLHASAVLGHNLSQVIGLNGASKKVQTRARKQLAVGEQQSFLELEEAPTPEPVKQVDSPKPERTGNGRGAPGKKRRAVNPANKVGYYISLERVVEVISQYPEGIRPREVAARIWRLDGHEDPAPMWVLRTVENRIAGAQADEKAGRRPLPFAIEYRDQLTKSGAVSGAQAKHLVPLAAPQEE